MPTEQELDQAWVWAKEGREVIRLTVTITIRPKSSLAAVSY